MPRPAPGWIAALPQSRLLAEFSMWSADLTRLADDLVRITPHADILHVDVADGIFAPSFLFFPDLVARLRDQTALPIHVHLMVDDAVLLSQIDQFAEAGADLISLHVENSLAGEALDRIAALGLRAGHGAAGRNAGGKGRALADTHRHADPAGHRHRGEGTGP